LFFPAIATTGIDKLVKDGTLPVVISIKKNLSIRVI